MLNGPNESIKLIAKLERGYLNHHGHTIPLWVQYLMATDRSKRIPQLVDKFINHVEARGNGWEVRFATKFGLVYAAMRMTTEAGLLPWRPSFALKVASKCYRKSSSGGARPQGACQCRCDETAALAEATGPGRRPRKQADQAYETHDRNPLQTEWPGKIRNP